MCNATGRPEPPHNVDWHKDDEKVRSDAHGGIIITKKIETRLQLITLSVQLTQEDRDSGAGEHVGDQEQSERRRGHIRMSLIHRRDRQHLRTRTHRYAHRLNYSTHYRAHLINASAYRRIGRYRRSEHRKSMTSLKLVADTPLRQLTLIVTLKKVKVAHTRLPSVGLRS